MSIESAVSHKAIQEELHKILSSKTLVQSKRLIRFLSFVVEKGLKEEGEQLNEYLIGVEVYERPASFDPQIDTIVRTEARRLRSKLRQYYESEGAYDPILIEIPKGSYSAVFRERDRGILDKRPGQVISHYRLVEKLGEGGMGTVYLGEDTQLGRQVALKFISEARLGEKTAKTRLMQEARAAAAIDHPNVAPVYEVGEVEGHCFIAMAYVKGQNLEDRIPEGSLEIHEALNVACQLADGLEAAHRKGVIHRDLNPANVILEADGRVRIIDFGLAQLTVAKRLTQPSTPEGTADYVSPEQMRGQAVDHRTDIWSLGVILYELFTGKRPFQGEHREAVYYAIAYRDPEPMKRWRSEIPEEWERIVLKCLEKEPARRYSNVGELKVDLSAARAQEIRTRERSSSTLLVPAESAQKSDLRSISVIRPNSLTGGEGACEEIAVVRNQTTCSPSPPPPRRRRGEEQIRVNSLAPTGGEGWKLDKLPRRPGEEATVPPAKLFDATKEEQPSYSTRPGSMLRLPGRTARLAVGAALVILLALAGSIWWFRTNQRGHSRQASTATATSIPRLAVLPFESRTSGEENQALSYAISDSMISSLAKLRGLQVTSWTSVVRLTERKATLAEIAKLLNVQYALEGSLLKSGTQGHVTAQLIRVADDSHVWSEEFDFPWKEILAVRKRVSESVVRQIKIQLRSEEQDLLSQNSTQSIEAYQAHAKGRYSLIRFSYLREPAFLNEAENDFKRALVEDPRYTDALADLAYVCFERFYPPQGDRKELATRGIAYAEQALSLDPNHVEALYVLGSLYDHAGEADKGLELCQKAVQLGPENPEAHLHLAWRYLQRGFYESGIEENDLAITKDSLFMDPYFYKTQFLCRLGKYEEALKEVSQLEKVEPSSPFVKTLRADIAFWQGDLPRAEALWRGTAQMGDPKPAARSDITLVLLAAISARRGQIEEARQALKGFDTTPSRVTDYPIKLAALVGEKDLAIDLIRNSSFHRNYRWLISDPDIASLRNEPRFRELLYELHQKWQQDLAELGPSLPILPPKLPTPEEYLSLQRR